MRLVIMVLVALFLLPSISVSQQRTPIDEIKQLQNLENLDNQLGQLEKIADEISKKKVSNCLKAFGNNQFCSCLVENLPIGILFEKYISIIISNREELGYNNLKTDEKIAIDMTFNARETCVNMKSRKKTKK